MRLVIYDDESMEPITVVNLRGMTDFDIESHGRRWRAWVPRDLMLPVPRNFNLTEEECRVVDLTFELLRRNANGRTVQTWMCFTKAPELAMLLNPTWLPGQRGAVDYLQRQNDRLTAFLMNALSR